MLTEAAARFNVDVTPGVDWITQQQRFAGMQPEAIMANPEFQFGNCYVRICPTKETPERTFLAGRLFGSAVEQLYSQAKR